ncbi:MAG TPA: DUF5611 family protein [Methanospirillum sp.]|nr:DUF5611 family protein [Methanospirillum sp.]
MQEYPIKRTHIKELPENIVNKLREHFGVEPEESDGVWRITYGALESLEVRMGETKKSMILGTRSLKGIEDEEIVLDTNRRFRRYLDDVTGYTTKERVKKVKTVD